MRNSRITPALAALASLITGANAHSWVQQLNNIGQNLSFVGAAGYPRGYVPQFNNSHWSDTDMVYLLPPNGGSNAYTDDLFLCKDTQRTHNQTEGFPMLRVTPGGAIALQYQENGHTTQPTINAGKAPNGGTVYIYGTASPKNDEKFTQVHKVWNADGTGGDKRGKLLATRDFDDKRCYQESDVPLAQQRKAQYPVPAALKQDPMDVALWCQNDFALPMDMPVGKPYTLYWIWDWPTTGLPVGNKNQSYQTCMDVQVVAGNANENKAIAAKAANAKINPQEVNLNYAGIPSQLATNSIMGSPTSGVAGAAAFGPATSSPTTAASSPASVAPGASTPSAPAAPPAAPAPSSPTAPAAPGITSTSFMTVTVTPTTIVHVSQTVSQTGSPTAANPAPVTKTVEITIMQTTTIMENPAASSGAVVNASDSEPSATVSGNFFQTAPATPASSSPSASVMPSGNCTKTAKKSVLFSSSAPSKASKRSLLSETEEDADEAADATVSTAARPANANGAKRGFFSNLWTGAKNGAKAAGDEAKKVADAVGDEAKKGAKAVGHRSLISSKVEERGLWYDFFHPTHHDTHVKRDFWESFGNSITGNKDHDNDNPASNFGEYLGTKRGLGFGRIFAGTVAGAERLATEVKDKVHVRGLNRLERARELRGD